MTRAPRPGRSRHRRAVVDWGRGRPTRPDPATSSGGRGVPSRPGGPRVLLGLTGRGDARGRRRPVRRRQPRPARRRRPASGCVPPARRLAARLGRRPRAAVPGRPGARHRRRRRRRAVGRRPSRPPTSLVTRTPGTALAVMVADCVPVLLADPAAGVVGVAHAGRAGHGRRGRRRRRRRPARPGRHVAAGGRRPVGVRPLLRGPGRPARRRGRGGPGGRVGVGGRHARDRRRRRRAAAAARRRRAGRAGARLHGRAAGPVLAPARRRHRTLRGRRRAARAPVARRGSPR